MSSPAAVVTATHESCTASRNDKLLLLLTCMCCSAPAAATGRIAAQRAGRHAQRAHAGQQGAGPAAEAARHRAGGAGQVRRAVWWGGGWRAELVANCCAGVGCNLVLHKFACPAWFFISAAQVGSQPHCGGCMGGAPPAGRSHRHAGPLQVLRAARQVGGVVTAPLNACATAFKWLAVACRAPELQHPTALGCWSAVPKMWPS